MSKERGKGQAHLPDLLHIDFSDLTRFRHLNYEDIKQSSHKGGAEGHPRTPP